MRQKQRNEKRESNNSMQMRMLSLLSFISLLAKSLFVALCKGSRFGLGNDFLA